MYQNFGPLVLILIAEILLWNLADTASFYGQSYVRVPFQLSAATNQIDLDFKTPRPHGLLLLAAGSTDYLSVKLSSGIIRVAVDLGSGEAILNSPAGLRLDDSQWHHVSVNRTSGNLVLTVDEIILTSTLIPGTFSEVNIQHGIFLGGIGTFTDVYDGTFKYFRGCIKSAFFNKYNILRTAQQLNNPVNTFEISWDCALEFDASSDQAISFLSDSSFVAFPPLHIREKGTFSCDLKTRSNSSVIFFNAGRQTSGLDYIGLELFDGKLKLTANKGSGTIDVFSDNKVNNGRWHQLDVIISPSMLELRVDGQRNITRFYSKDNKYLNLAGLLYVGGVSVKDKSNAIRRGLESLKQNRGMHSSLKGCIRNVVLNERSYGFREMVVSRVVEPKCSWDYPCTNEPCIAEAECKELNKNEFKCICNKNVCTKSTVTTVGNVGERNSADVLAIEQLKVEEGGESELTTNVIDVIFDYQAYQIRESSIQFTIKVAPLYGSIEVNLHRRRNEYAFTMLDLIGGKVTYSHDGTDTRSDDVTIEMKITSSDSNIPKYYQGNFNFVLPILISSRNDPPKFVLVAGSSIQVLKHTKTKISNQILNVDDPDSKPSQIMYKITYINTDKGYFAKENTTNKELYEFSQADINAGTICYVHLLDGFASVRLKVNDGFVDSAEAEVTLVAVDIDIIITLNTGIVLPFGTSALISSDNLTSVANVQGQTIDLRYRIVQKPKYGFIQRKQHEDNTWVTVETFSQRHINKQKLRYISTNDLESQPSDEFKFVVSARESTTVEYTFSISLKKVQIQIVRNEPLILNNEVFSHITTDLLLVKSESNSIFSDQIMYKVIAPLSHGQLYLIRSFQKVTENVFKDISSVTEFSQKDVDNHYIYYKLSRPHFNQINETVNLKVSYLNSAQTIDILFSVCFLPEQSSIRFTNNGIKGVIEGGSKIIEKEDLYLEVDSVKETMFTVLSLPEFGILQLKEPRSNAVLQRNISEFSSINIREGKLYYKHDDSEHDEDSFTFIAMPLYTEEEEISGDIQEISGTFEIKMMMRNDNPPVREVNKIFHIVTNEKKVLTIRDVAFSDPDINYDSSKLQFTRRGIPNGEIIDRNSGSPVYLFTQQDLIDEKLFFQHKGPDDYGRAALWVTDGQFFTTSLFEIQASLPYVKVENNTGISVEKGSYSTITNYNLSMETNVYVEPNQVNIVLIEEPLFGHLRVKGQRVAEFAYKDLISGDVKFWHDGSTNQEDKFTFAIIVNNVKVQDIFPIFVFLESQLHPPRVSHNKILEVSEGSGAIITQSHLNVNHPDSIPTDITYTITTKPLYGAIYVKGVLADEKLTVFTQQDIIDDYVKYTNTINGVLADKMVFDVGNQFQSLKDLEFFIEIVPNVLLLQSDVLNVREGGRTALQPQNFKLKGRFFQGKDIVFEIKRQPQSGLLDSNIQKGVLVSSFTSEDLRHKMIYYEHDGSERLADEFTIVATLSDNSKASLPHIVEVTIESVNDQAPRIIVNSVLEVWKGSVTRLSNQSLLAQDPDSNAYEIIFSVSSPTNGHIAYLNNTFHKISQFSQSDVNKGLVVFVHEGDNKGEFNIQATDGVNNDILQVFHIEAQPLTLSLEVNKPLQVFPATLQPLTMDILYTYTNAINITKPIIYTLETRPGKGNIVTIENGTRFEVTSFTQKDLEKSKIYYQHSSKILHWSEHDSLLFEVSTVYAEPLQEELLDIQISYGNINSENINQFLRTSGPSVREGSEITIRQEHLDLSLLERRLYQFDSRVSVDFMLIRQPTHGYLEKARRKLETADIFTQREISQGDIKYFHDDSDTEEDFFEFAIQIHPPERAVEDSGIDSYDYETNFTIAIKPVNDQNFKLITTSPYIQVIQGQRANITFEDLKTTDPDTGPTGLKYEIRTAPKYGRLIVGSDTGRSVTSFSQQDVNDNQVVFISDGSKESDSFFFRVSDGVHTPYYKTFQIYVLQISVKVNSLEPIYLIQSESSVYISPKSLNITTNGDRNKVWYNVTKEPEHGRIHFQETFTKYFSQQDIDNSLMLYIQSDLSYGADHFICDLYVEGVNLFISGQRYDIRVKPLLEQGPLYAPAGSKVAITKYNLDASRLAAITGDNPEFDIKEQPKHGHIVKSSRTKRNLNVAPIYKPVDHFTHEDIVYTKVFYQADANSHLNDVEKDTFLFTLRAKNVQPASGKFVIDFQPSNITPLPPSGTSTPIFNGDHLYPMNTVEPHDTSTLVEDAEVKSPEDGGGDDETMLIIIVVIIIILIFTVIIVIAVIMFRRYKIKEKENAKAAAKPKPRPYISGPLQLEQPHVHIEPKQCLTTQSNEDAALVISPTSSCNIPVINISHELDSQTKQPRSPDLTRVEVSQTVPSCKVTPLIEIANNSDDKMAPLPGSANSNNSAELFNFDWTLMDSELLQHCRSTTPVLSQNQYWV